MADLVPFSVLNMSKLTTLDAVRMNRADADAIVAAGELVDLRFVSGDSLSLRAAKLFCLLVQEAGVAVADDVQHRVPYSVLNETFHRSRDELAKAVHELHSTVVSVEMVSRRGRATSQLENRLIFQGITRFRRRVRPWQDQPLVPAPCSFLSDLHHVSVPE